jgi:microcystin-dependent protein
VSTLHKVQSQSQLPPIDGTNASVGDLGYTLDDGGFWDAAQPSAPPGATPVWSFVDILRGSPGPKGDAGIGLPGSQGNIGPPGQAGSRGPQGPAGKNSFSQLSNVINIPAVAAQPLTIHVTDTSWMIAGMLIYIVGAGTFNIVGTPSDLYTAQIANSGDPTNQPAGTAIAAGTTVSPASQRGPTGPQGTAGPQGPPGPQGVSGSSAFSTLSQTFTIPAVGSSAIAFVQNASPFAAGQIVYIQAGDYCSVSSVNTTNNSLTLVNQGYPGGAAPGVVVPIGNTVSGTGPQGPQGIPGPQGPQGPQGLIGVAPTGAMFAWPTVTPPGGYLLCDNSLYSRTAYAALFAIIGTAYNQAGDDPSMFRTPDVRGRVLLGVGQSTAPGNTAHALNSTGGEETHALDSAELSAHTHGLSTHTHSLVHTHTMGNHTHAGANHLHDLQNHSHAGANHLHDLQNHTHGYTAPTFGAGGYNLQPQAGGVQIGSAGANTGGPSPNNTGFADRGLQTGGPNINSSGWSDRDLTTAGPSTNTTDGASVSVTAGPSVDSTTSTGSGTAFNELPPYLTVNWIIKT